MNENYDEITASENLDVQSLGEKQWNF